MTQLSRRLAILCVVCITLVNLAFIPSAFAEPAPTADLVITSLTISPTSPVQGVNATVSITVQNQGTGKAYGFVVQWKSAQNALSGPTAQIASLNAGASTTVNFTYAFPNEGNFMTVATVDSANQVDETNETNNVAIKDATVRPTAPDLYVTSFSVSPVNPVQNRVATINVGITNKGTGASGAFIVQWRSDRNIQTGPSQPVIPGLAAGATKFLSFEYSFPRSGNFTTVVQVDTANSVDEIDEANNLEILALTVLRPGIDLVITNFTLDPVKPVQGRMSQATITVQNQGNTPAGAFNVKWQPQPFVADISRQVNGLQPGESETLVIDHTFPLAGQYRSVVEVDSTRRVFEVDETNNTATKVLTVDPPRSDLIVSSFVITPNPAVAGLLTTAEIGVTNIGNSPAGVFVVNWRPSPLAQDLSKEVQGLAVGQSIMLTFDFTFPAAGNILSVATADSTNKVLELLETNNSRALQLTVEVPTMDLVVTAISVTPFFGEQCGGDGREGRLCCSTIIDNDDSPRIEGDSLSGTSAPQLIGDNTDVVEDRPYQVCITVQNQGNFPTGPFLVEWTPTPYLNQLPPGLSAVSEQVNTLGPGAFATVLFEYTWPNPGDFRMVATADAKNTVRETNEANNIDVYNVNVTKTPIDLTITSLSINPATPVQGSEATMTIGLANLGTNTAGPFVVEWNPGALGLGTPGPSTVSKQVDGLGGGGTTSLQLKFTYSEFGNFRSVVKVDALSAVSETNEANNLAILNVKVNPAPVDLVVTAFNLAPNPLVRGSKAIATITVKNNGNYPVNNFAVQWKPNVAVNTGPVSFIPGLNANESKTITLETTYYVADVYSTSATVDVYNQVVETNEGNNVSSKTADVKPRETTLRVTFQSLSIVDAKEDGIDGNAEWFVVYGLLDPGSNCSISGGDDVPDFSCDDKGDDALENGDTMSLNRSFNVTLVESTPLVLAAAGFEGDDILGIPTGGSFTGYALAFWGAQDYLNLGSQTIQGTEGECGGGRCFDLNYKVEVVSKPPALASELGASELPAPVSITLSKGMSKLIPTSADLPAGLFVQRQIFVPFVRR